MRRKRIWLLLVVLLLIWLVSVSRPGLDARGCLVGCSPDGNGRPDALSVLSLNMLHGHPDFEDLGIRLELIAKGITDSGADVVLLQEVPWTRRHGDVAAQLAESAGMNYVYYRANGNRWAILFEEGEAVLSRYPIKDTGWVELKPSAGLFENRVALRATIETPLGLIDFYTTHLTDGAQEANGGQAEALRRFVEGRGDHPAVIAGDFNALDTEAHMLALSDTWLDAFRQVGHDEPGFTCCIDDLHATASLGLDKRIDYLFVADGQPANLGVRSARLFFTEPSARGDGWQWASDHLGLLVELARTSQSSVKSGK